jgi:hypothetical protein
MNMMMTILMTMKKYKHCRSFGISVPSHNLEKNNALCVSGLFNGIIAVGERLLLEVI